MASNYEKTELPYYFGQWTKDELSHIKVPSAEEKNIRSVLSTHLSRYKFVCSDQYGFSNIHFSALLLAIKHDRRTRYEIDRFYFDDVLVFYQSERISEDEVREILTMRRERG